MYGSIVPFDCVFFAESALVMGLWWTGITALTGARLAARLFSGAERSHRRSHIWLIDVLPGHETDAGATGSLTLFTFAIFTIVFLGQVSIVVALEETLEILEGVVVKVALIWYT